jgi:hypothetical protein
MRSGSLPRHPAVAYLFLVRSMRVRAYIWIALVTILAPSAWAADKSVEVTLEDSPVREKPISDAELARWKQQAEEFGVKFKAACDRGNAAAEKDIKAGRFRIHKCGDPTKKDETDSKTSYRIERVGPCSQRNVYFDAEVEAYNRTMRVWNAKHRTPQRSNQTMQVTAGRRSD